ncbi:MAG: carbohydrate ABC transporter permease [Agathobacter sp.]|uniref:carbohydrate ABC transporter permease n=1 Tax=Agathobacter sp. TaxID=2021311 RepID=UPI0004E0B809|nr:carbohydrate ABC transporter permease [Agathobacter sp.]MBQ1681696.1 carbohydrate ABC transporter permease [Agathobacter sp.]
MKNNTTSKGLGIHSRRAIAYIILILLSFFCLIWFFILFINATRANSELGTGFTIVPGTYLLKNWETMIHRPIPIVRGMFNSLFVAAMSAILCTYFSSMTAYAIHAYEFKARKAVFTLILMIMTIPTQVSALGFIQLIGNIGLRDSHWALILPSIAAPVTFFYMKQYMDSTLPLSLIEAARIDGAGEFKIFNTMVVPLMKPAIAVQAIFCFVGSWNNFFVPTLVLDTETKKTLPILIAELRNTDWATFDMGAVYMSIAFSIFPVIIVYLILSKHIVGGMTLGGVKG